MLQYNDWIKECVRMLSKSPIESDRRLAIWFELQIITDEALSSFGLDDTASTAPLTETRVNAVLRLFDKKMDDWKENLDAEDLTGKNEFIHESIYPFSSPHSANGA